MMRQHQLTGCLLNWLLLVMLLITDSTPLENGTPNTNEKSEGGLISPRMDYEEWTPLGRGDPLKNNPTFDYVPPVLDRVQYWLDSQTTEASAKRDILVLGVTAKKTSPKISERYFELVDSVDGPPRAKTKDRLQHRADFTGSIGAEPPNVLRTSNFKQKPIIPPSHEYNSPKKSHRIPASYYPSPYHTQYGKQHRTRLLSSSQELHPSGQNFLSNTRPDDNVAFPSHNHYKVQSQFTNNYERPMGDIVRIQGSSEVITGNKEHFNDPSLRGHVLPTKPVGNVITTAHTNENAVRNKVAHPGTVSVEKSSLIYESTHTISGNWLGGQPPLISKAHNPFRTLTEFTPYDGDYDAAPSVNRPVVVLQNATVTQPTDSFRYNESILSTDRTQVNNKTLSNEVSVTEQVPTSSTERMHIIIANSQPTDLATNEVNTSVAIVMPTSYSNETSPTITENLQLTTSTVVPSEVTTSAPHFVHQLINNSGNDPLMFVPPKEMSSVTVPLIEGIRLQNQGMRQQSTGSNHVFFPSAVHPQAHSRLRPNSQPYSPYVSGMHPQVDSHMRPMNFAGSMHSTIGSEPGSLSKPMMGSRQPMPMFMSMPVEMRVSMPMPVAHVSHNTPFKKTHGLMKFPGTLSSLNRAQSPMSGLPQFQSNSAMLQPSTLPADMLPPDISLSTVRTVDADGSTKITASNEFNPPNGSINKGIEEEPIVKLLIGEKAKEEGNGKVEEVKISDIDKNRGYSSAESQERVELEHQKTTTVASLTTDPIFSHYKQPAKPIRGPMYLIIQGHSKVKTYKPNVSAQETQLKLQEKLDIADESKLSKFDQYVRVRENAKKEEKMANSEGKQKAEDKESNPEKRTLMSLVESGLGDISTLPGRKASIDTN